MAIALERRLAALEATKPASTTDMDAWWQDVVAMLASMAPENRAHALAEVPVALAKLTDHAVPVWRAALEAAIAAHNAAAGAACPLPQH